MWLGYNYNGINNLKLILSYDVIALSRVELVFSALDGTYPKKSLNNLNSFFQATPIIDELKPESLAVDSVGPLIIVGQIKIDWFLYVCMFRDEKSNPNY